MKTPLSAKLLRTLIIILFILSLSCSQRKTYQYPFQDPTLSVEKRVDNLVSLLTLDEKVSQMMNNAPAIARLGIPAYNWWNECLHGVARSPYRATSFPQAIGMAATWDTASLHLMASFSADEGRAINNDSKRKGKTGIFTGLTYWTPNINIFRDPRWGRGQETYGEDPFLTGEMGKAFVTGLQGDDPKYLKASACAKHYAVHSGPEWSRHTYNAVVSKYDLWDTYLPAFRALVVDAKVSGVMCAYNAFEGEPCCGSGKLMNDILRKDWKFEGYVTSDCGAIGDFYRTHKTSPDAENAAADAVLHGTDCECGNSYRTLKKAVTDTLISEKQLDISLKRLFTIRFRLGMFDPDEMVPYSKTDISVLESDSHKAHALKMAQQSIVLLKNEKNTLPLNKNLKKIAVVGPNADDRAVLLANYYGYPSKVTTVLEGIRNKLGSSTEIIYEKAVSLTDNTVFKSMYNNNCFSFNGNEGFNAEYFRNTRFEGTPRITRIEKMVDYQWGDGEDIADSVIARRVSVRWTTTFSPVKTGEVSFELSGDDGCRLVIDGEKKIDSNSTGPYYTFMAQSGKSYKFVIEYWQNADNAEIKFDMGTIEKTNPKIIASRVKDADAIIFVGGISAKLEGEQMRVETEGFKGGDRTSLDLPKIQTELLKELIATGKPVVFVSMSGSALGFEWEKANVPAIVQAWYGGQSGGTAIADVLFGDYNPSGRLPVTFYKNVKDLPDFEDYSMENRTYRFFKGEVLYPFGYGLSYTTFKYDNLQLSDTFRINTDINFKVNVINTGRIDGDEVVQLYVSQKNTGGRTPIRALKGFQRIHLKAGETKQVMFTLWAKDLGIIDSTGKLLPGAGNIEISTGGCQPSENSIAEGKCVRKTIVLD